ncbi:MULTISPECIES: rhodanese-like domain-containing protein [Bacillaceae]|uniref:rhodanese-like domain-containing protein n=1 Tax=Bacillaceae TaxID=186817 RepID=UPI00080AF094|nr:MULTISPECIES: rhodanese-like domain-containing protein [Bacillaceae]OCA86361.1 rhodanese-like domain-containing protein [Bacillus sp. FJAT-27986]
MPTSLIVLIVLAVLIIGYSIYSWFSSKKMVTTLSQEDFKAGYRKAQLIDVREQKEFDGGHILGARNIPSTQLKMRMKELRKDKPVYLYCQSGMRSTRAAQMLYKKGYRELYQLEGGFKQWKGKIKTK